MSQSPERDLIALASDPELDLHELAGFLGEPLPYAAGLRHAVTGDEDYAACYDRDNQMPAADQVEYARGMRDGGYLLEEKVNAECWDEIYAVPPAEGPECGPVDASDIPW